MVRLRNPARSLLSALSSPTLTVGVLALLMILVAYGTLFQVGHGLFEAHQRIFDAWIFFPGGCLPFPGVRSTVLILCVNLVAAGLARFRRSVRNIGLLCTHLGIAVMLIGAAAGGMVRSESVLTIGKGETASLGTTDTGYVALPFRCTLLDFSIRYHPGTTAPADYLSRLHVAGPGIDRDVVVGMNRPFRFRDYTVYQSSFREDEEDTVSELAVVKNPLRNLPPFAAIIIAAGIILHFGIKLTAGSRVNHA
jgi:hypothetical protein